MNDRLKTALILAAHMLGGMIMGLWIATKGMSTAWFIIGYATVVLSSFFLAYKKL